MFDLIKYSFCCARSAVSRLQRMNLGNGERSVALDAIDAETRRDKDFHASVVETLRNNGVYYALSGFSFSGMLSLIPSLHPLIRFAPIALLGSLLIGGVYSKTVGEEIEAYRSEILAAGFHLTAREADPTDVILIEDAEADLDAESEVDSDIGEEEIFDDREENGLVLNIL